MIQIARILLTALVLGATFTAQAGEAEIRKNLAAQIPQLGKIDEVNKTPVPGLYEVRINNADIVYTDEQGNYLLHGNLLDLRAQRNLTEERVSKLTEVPFNKLPLEDAIKIVRGNGSRKLAVFADPNCGYCKRFEKDLRNISDITVYLFLYPVLSPDSTVKSHAIWCSKDRVKSWYDWMLDGVAPSEAPGKCSQAPLQRNIEFGRRYAITGTPTLFFTSGKRIPGAVPAAQVEKELTAAK